MGKPSIFSRDYHKIMRRRRIIYTLVVIMILACGGLFFYNKSIIPEIKNLAENVKFKPFGNKGEKRQESIPSKFEDVKSENENKADDSGGEKKKEEPAPAQSNRSEYVFQIGNNESIALIFEYNNNEKKFVDVKIENNDIFFDIREDGKAIVFDDSIGKDIWIYNIDGTCKKLSLDRYKEFSKDKIMAKYNNKYTWAARPKFLKDGRVVYQSNLPWFKSENECYLWVVNSDGSGNRKFVNTDQNGLVKYSDFTEDGKLIIEYGGSKYSIDNKGNKQKID